MSWYNPATWFNTDSAAGMTGDELDAALAKQNQDLLDRGIYSQTAFETAEAQRKQSHIDVDQQLTDAAVSGINEGVDNVRNSIGGAINTVTDTFVRLLPWQIWAIGLAVAAFYLWPWIGPRLMKGAR